MKYVILSNHRGQDLSRSKNQTFCFQSNAKISCRISYSKITYSSIQQGQSFLLSKNFFFKKRRKINSFSTFNKGNCWMFPHWAISYIRFARYLHYIRWGKLRVDRYSSGWFQLQGLGSSMSSGKIRAELQRSLNSASMIPEWIGMFSSQKQRWSEK